MSVMLYPYIFCVALVIDPLVLCVACRTVFAKTNRNILGIVVIECN